MKDTVQFLKDSIRFRNYDLIPSRVYSKGSVKKVLAKKIDEFLSALKTR